MDLHRPASSAPFRNIELPRVEAGPVIPSAAEPSPSSATEPPAAAPTEPRTAKDAEPPPSASPQPADTQDAEPPSSPDAQHAQPGSDAWVVERQCEEAELEALESRITELWGHINAATAQFLALLAEFDRREGWAQHGVASCAHWLNWQCGISAGAAREKVRVARALTSLPKIAQAFGEGRLSYSKVRAVTRVATAETEDSLLNIALHGTAAHVERTVKGFRRVLRVLERDEAEAIHERRYLDCRREADGSVRIEARLTPEVGELLLKALDAAQTELDERSGEAETAGAAENAGADAADVDAPAANVPAGTSGPNAAQQEAAEPTGVPAGTYASEGSGQRGASPTGVPAGTLGTQSMRDACAESSHVPAGTSEAQTAQQKPSNAATENVPAGTSGSGASQQRCAPFANVPAGTHGTQPALPEGVEPPDVPAGTPRRSVSQRRADALGHILERFVTGKCSGSANGAHQVVVHIAHDALCDVPESSGAEFDDGRAVTVETARRLGCDGALIGVVEGEKGEPLAVGRRTRAVPSAIRRALRVRDGGCRFPGCDRSRFVHAHHIRHWADGGETKLDNLVTLCSQHHRLVHEGGYGIRMNNGEIEFMRPTGRAMPSAGKPPGAFPRERHCASEGSTKLSCQGGQTLARSNAARGLDIDAQTARCGWMGERMDYNTAIDGLCWQAGYR